MEIGIQGIAGSFHHQAARAYFQNVAYAIKPYHSFRALAEAIDAQAMDYGIMAIENTIAGSILTNYALIHEYDLKISGELYCRIEMNLIAHAGKTAHDLRQVYSHPMALLQCADYLAHYPHLKLIEYEDTADSVRMIQEQGLTRAGAIAGREAADMYQLSIIEPNIETNKKNYTRFLMMKSRKSGELAVAEKASLRVITKHTPGSLVGVLSTFQAHGINLTKIQSVPIVGKPYHYAFHLDVVWADYDDYQKALRALRDQVEMIKVYGEYKKGNIPTLT